MSRKADTVMQFSCDGCGKVQWVPEYDGPPIPWYNGTAIFHHAGGGDGGEWDACSQRCIKNAIMAVVHS